jgi:hypothetical protein
VAKQVSQNPARIEVLTEEEAVRGWRYRIAVDRAVARTEHDVTLAWVDHEHWSGGRLPPSAVVQAVVRYAAARKDDLPARFDAATCRRWFPALDTELSLFDGADAT